MPFDPLPFPGNLEESENKGSQALFGLIQFHKGNKDLSSIIKLREFNKMEFLIKRKRKLKTGMRVCNSRGETAREESSLRSLLQSFCSFLLQGES